MYFSAVMVPVFTSLYGSRISMIIYLWYGPTKYEIWKMGERNTPNIVKCTKGELK